LIEHFRDKDRRKEFFKEYKEIEMLYEIISPDAYLRPYIEDYTTVSRIYDVGRKAYTKRVMVDRDFQRKTNELVQKHIGAKLEDPENPFVFIDKVTLDTIAAKDEGKATKVINLVKSIEKQAEDESDDPFLVAMAERAKAVQEAFEDRQTTTEKALAELFKELEKNKRRKHEQAEKGLDGLSYFVLCKLTEDGVPISPSTRLRRHHILAATISSSCVTPFPCHKLRPGLCACGSGVDGSGFARFRNRMSGFLWRVPSGCLLFQRLKMRVCQRRPMRPLPSAKGWMNSSS